MTNFAKSMEHITNHYSSSVKDLIITLSNKHNNMYPTIDDICSLISTHFIEQCDRLYAYNDMLQAELAKEAENGRLFRLLAKMGYINERPSYDNSPSWSETGDRYVLKLYRDYVFHQVNEDTTPVLDFAHVVESLNKLDVGSNERLLLMSRNEKTMLLVTYNDIKRLMNEAYDELLETPAQPVQSHPQAAQPAVGYLSGGVYIPPS
eukprot:TRINITY_DN1608_c0_g1_i1.p2 TRINITY_DN1608_c0_g1~~TRINITY_DN1608_c0_g1_i1.p2  ORF type:complete len:206 (-),score=33.05 TRINITY_DN1608_c0_g1_i1:6-623(-)